MDNNQIEWGFICPKCKEKCSMINMVSQPWITDVTAYELTIFYECPECHGKLTEKQIIKGARQWLKTLSPEELAEMLGKG